MSGTTPYHLCLTHSPLTSAVFEAAMKRLDVPPDRIRSFSRRAVAPVGSGVRLDDLSDNLQSAYKRFDRRGYARLRSALVHRLEELTGGESFLAYIPHTRQIVYQEMIDHPKCAGYFFIEEGFTSMAWKSHRNVKLSRAKRFQHAIRKLWTGSRFNAASVVAWPSTKRPYGCSG